MMTATRALLLAAAPLLLLAGCANPQLAGAVDCRGATAPCGIWTCQEAKAMSNQPLTVPLIP